MKHISSSSGGEPLLEFKIIKELTDYAKNRLDSSVKFSFTTNGMALIKLINSIF